MIPVEIKSRVAYHNFDCARRRLKKVLGADRYFSHLTYYFCMKADDPKLQDLIGDDKKKSRFTGEAYQMLHHAHVYGVERCLFLVGSKTKLLYVIEVEFPQSLLEAYGHVTNELFTRYYSFLYGTYEKDSFPEEKVQEALEQVNLGRKKVDQVSWHSFTMNYRLWRALNVGGSVRFPLPPCDRFLPCQNADWNLAKGPSDTLTKLFDDCEESVTIRSPQTIAVSRLLVVSASAFHRCLQTIGAKESTESYKSVDNYRKAASNRSTFKSSLMQLTQFLWEEFQELEKESFMAVPNKENAQNGQQCLRDIPQLPAL